VGQTKDGKPDATLRVIVVNTGYRAGEALSEAHPDSCNAPSGAVQLCRDPELVLT